MTCDDPTRPRHALPHAFCSLSPSRITYHVSIYAFAHLYPLTLSRSTLSSLSRMLIDSAFRLCLYIACCLDRWNSGLDVVLCWQWVGGTHDINMGLVGGCCVDWDLGNFFPALLVFS